MSSDWEARLRGGFIGLAVGVVGAIAIARWSARGWLDAIEKGDFDTAQTRLRWWYFGYLPQWLLTPPPDTV